MVRNQRLTHNHIETPYFLIDEQELESNLNQLEEALRKHWVTRSSAFIQNERIALVIELL